jgi:hypothetical protein
MSKNRVINHQITSFSSALPHFLTAFTTKKDALAVLRPEGGRRGGASCAWAAVPSPSAPGRSSSDN